MNPDHFTEANTEVVIASLHKECLKWFPTDRVSQFALVTRNSVIAGNIIDNARSGKFIDHVAAELQIDSQLYPLESSLMCMFMKRRFDISCYEYFQEITHGALSDYDHIDQFGAVMSAIISAMESYYDEQITPDNRFALRNWCTGIKTAGESVITTLIVRNNFFTPKRVISRLKEACNTIDELRYPVAAYINPALGSPVQFR